jgi:hypothetical protein
MAAENSHDSSISGFKLVEITMAQFTINIEMDQNTVESLSDAGFYLYAFKAVKSSIKRGAPLVWFKTKEYSKETAVTWEVKFSAFTSKVTDLKDGTKITASAPYPIDLGGLFTVTSETGTGDVTTDGSPGGISIRNKTEKQFTCGISQVSSSGTNQLCALPLFGGNLDLFVPIEQVLLTFATNEVNTGTVIYQAYAPSLMVDLTGETSRTVTYDLNKNWKDNTAGWARKIPVNDDLVPLLIQSSPQAMSASTNLTRRLASSSEAEKVSVIDLPEGKYVKVSVDPITGTGSLRRGTGTMSSFGVFSCGTFDNGDLPQSDKLYNIIATSEQTQKLYQFPGTCVHSDPTSDFK